MTLDDLTALAAIKSPIVCGGNVGIEDLARFLWIISERFTPGAESFKAFTDSLPSPDLAQLAADIREYLDLVFLDKPGSGEGPASPVAGAAGLIDQIASEYGWTRAEIRDTPLPQLFQLQRAALIRKGCKVAVFNRLADRAANAYAAARNAIPVNKREAWHAAQWAEIQKERAA